MSPLAIWLMFLVLLPPKAVGDILIAFDHMYLTFADGILWRHFT